ncbi:hypothetical protein [Actinokineospora iranica]|uniref:Uncharacterized protein n=1 Tax=Actinokineospora iranica TaxID=1271860 RepID=A0A1G6M578_9PSEU|nr:hypothetical protein [Actinokineospora iranica]SDC50630.1 hypothetical protein SAMN05216174_102379 [Actinokineospora iranica]
MNAETAAVAAFPELRRLIDLREVGWVFLPTVVDGRVVEVHGVRTWPHGWADAIRVRFITDAAALRCDYTGGITWERDGGLVEVVDELLMLPEPGQRLAPHLVMGRAPTLWAP